MPLKPIEHRLEERFRRYSAITTQSDPHNLGKCIPSTPGQQVLAELLAGELRAMGLQDVICDAHATVTAVKPGNVPGAPRIGFIYHLDTFDSGLCPHVKAQKIHYTGGDVCLNAEKKIWMRLQEHPELNKYVGQDILFSDGTSVLGADDKAAIASVMEMIASLDSREEKHGDIIVCFVPDEEDRLGRCEASRRQGTFQRRLCLHARLLRARGGRVRVLQRGERDDQIYRCLGAPDVGQGRDGEPAADGCRLCFTF
ncbi:hypothetical protein LSCM1_05497 [Leishmania martiniquensis]|uniref:Tripeptide aminopeptidase n=1 Tax=Leishmania martiniquensis TaxID=1580590 RepID=A0A836HR93_9TRYP|nr:hypothetical protein LSCM1_05497 [Leishmania martiniquensis]